MILIQVAVLISAESVAAFLTYSADHSVGATSLFGRCKAAAVGVQTSRATPLAISTNLRINIEQILLMHAFLQRMMLNIETYFIYMYFDGNEMFEMIFVAVDRFYEKLDTCTSVHEFAFS